MPFQSSVFPVSGLGVVGDLYTDGPHRAQSFILNSSDAANNVFGRVFTKSSEGVARAGGTGIFAGFLCNPKGHASYGTAVGGPLAPTLTLANYTQADLLTMGSILVALPAAAAIGDIVLYNTTTGALSTIAPGATYPSGTLPAHAVVDYFTVSSAGLAVITVTDVPPIPEAA